MARTFADLIKSVSRNLGDLYEGTLTGATNANTLQDSSLTEGDGWYTGGSLALVTASAPSNVGAERKITSWLQAGGTFGTNGFPVTPSAGDTYEVRRRPKHTRAAVREFINQAVRETERQSWVSVDSRADLADTTTYAIFKVEYQVPTIIELVRQVLYLDITCATTLTTATLPSSATVGDYYYLSDTQSAVEWSGSAWIPSTKVPWVELDQDKWQTNATGTILIQPIDNYADWDQSWAPVPDGAPLRFLGSKRPGEFVLDTDITPFEGNYLEVFATARMCLRLAEGAQDEVDFNQKFQFYYKLETDAFRGTRRGLPSGSRKVR